MKGLTAMDGAKGESIHILFIGNSFTFQNNMPALLQQLARAAGYPAAVDSVAIGGYYFRQYAAPQDRGAKDIARRLKGRRWDYVLLQEQSTNPMDNPPDFEGSAAALIRSARENGAAVFLYQTWAFERGSEKLASSGYGYEEMYEGIRAAYEALALKQGVGLCPVGNAFYRVAAERKDFTLYDPDQFHPSLEGSYLAACVHFAMLFGASPLGNGFTAGLEGERAAYLQQAAWETAQQERRRKTEG